MQASRVSIKETAENIQKAKDLGRQHGQDIGVYSVGVVTCRDTQKEAEDYYHYIVHEKGDWDAVDNLVTTMIANAKTLPKEVLAEMKKHFIAGWGGFPIIGTKEQIVETLGKLSACGFDGVLLTFAQFQQGMTEFRDKTYPLLLQSGLR